MSNIREAIRRLAQGAMQTVSVVCTVDSVDRKARTVDCTPIDESAPLLGVNLQANQKSGFGIVAYPKVGSYVVVGFIADGAAGAVLLADEIESFELVIDDTKVEIDKDGIRLNGGALGGLVKVVELTGRLNAIEQDLNALKTAFNGWTPTAQDGGSALKAAASSWAGATLKLSEREDYENVKIKQ